MSYIQALLYEHTATHRCNTLHHPAYTAFIYTGTATRTTGPIYFISAVPPNIIGEQRLHISYMQALLRVAAEALLEAWRGYD